MAVRRLGRSQQTLKGVCRVEGVPAPGALAAGRSRLARVLMALAPGAVYDAVMSLCGIAFSLPVLPNFTPAPHNGIRGLRVEDGLAALGLSAAVSEPPGAEAAVSLVQGALGNGFPVPVLGWPRDASGWGLITGYDAGRGVFVGWHPAEDVNEPVAALPAGEVLIVVESQGTVPDREASARAALAWAAGRSADLRQAHSLWAEAVAADWSMLDSAGFAERLAGHEDLFERTADARTAAASFLRRCAGASEDPAAAHLSAAAEAYGALVEVLDARRPHTSEEGVGDAFLSPDWRAEWLAELARVAELDLLALEAIQCFLDHVPAPDDAAQGPEDTRTERFARQS